MDATYDSDRLLLRLELDDEEALAAFVADLLAQGAFLAEPAAVPRLHDQVEVELSSAGRPRGQARARVVQLFERPGGRWAVALELLGGASLERLAVRPEVAEGESTGVSPAFRIRQLSVPERIRLAPRADRLERQILLRDSSPQVAIALLANPRLEEGEVAELIRSGALSTALLERLAKDPRWTASYDIRKALASHPRTPMPHAVRLLATLSRQDLGQLARAGRAREPVRKAALRLYLKRL